MEKSKCLRELVCLRTHYAPEIFRSRAIIIAKGYFRSLIFFPSVRPFVRLAFWEKRSNCLLDENVLNKSYFKLTRDVAEHTLPTKN